MSPTNTDFSSRVSGAVAAELARRGHTGSELIPVLGLSKNTIYSRLRSESSFDADELEKIAHFLKIDVAIIWASAELGKEAANKVHAA